MSQFIEVEALDRVRTIALNRPGKLNALTHEMYDDITDALDAASADKAIRAVVIYGKGDAFTAGNDLNDFAASMPAGKLPVIRFLETLRDFEKPVLAAVNGHAVGVGVTMLLHCDLCFSSEMATFSAPFAQIGLVPEAGSSLLIPQALGIAWANDLLLAGRKLTATEAVSLGLASRLYAPEVLVQETLDVAAKIAAQAPNAMQRSKKLIRSDRDTIKGQMEKENTYFHEQLRSPEFKEAANAFREKRSPVFD